MKNAWGSSIHLQEDFLLVGKVIIHIENNSIFFETIYMFLILTPSLLEHWITKMFHISIFKA